MLPVPVAEVRSPGLLGAVVVVTPVVHVSVGELSLEGELSFAGAEEDPRVVGIRRVQQAQPRVKTPGRIGELPEIGLVMPGEEFLPVTGATGGYCSVGVRVRRVRVFLRFLL